MPMDPARLAAALCPPRGRYAVVEVHDRLDSTNLRAAQLATAYAVVVAEAQSAGRGRLGRQWESPSGAAVTVSFTLPLEIAEPGWLPLVAGLAVAETITERCGLDSVVKWPNDVLLPADDHRKVCGVLCEIVPAASPADTAASVAARGSARVPGLVVVIGIGLNVDQTRDELPVTTATSLKVTRAGAGHGQVVSREDLVIDIGDRLADLESRLRRGGADAAGVRAAYRARCATIGAPVTVSLPGGDHVAGTATGITDDGSLVVATNAGERTFSAGDVTHVRPAATGRSGLA